MKVGNITTGDKAPSGSSKATLDGVCFQLRWHIYSVSFENATNRPVVLLTLLSVCPASGSTLTSSFVRPGSSPTGIRRNTWKSVIGVDSPLDGRAGHFGGPNVVCL